MKKILIEEDEFILLVETMDKSIINDLLYCQALQYIKLLNKKWKCYRVNKDDLVILFKFGFLSETEVKKIPELWIVKNKNVIERISDFQYCSVKLENKEKLI